VRSVPDDSRRQGTLYVALIALLVEKGKREQAAFSRDDRRFAALYWPMASRATWIS
jgi:hypothetical protein